MKPRPKLTAAERSRIAKKAARTRKGRRRRPKRLLPEEKAELVRFMNGDEECSWALAFHPDECEGLAWIVRRLQRLAERGPYRELATFALEGMRRMNDYQALCHNTLHAFEQEIIMLRMEITARAAAAEATSDDQERLPN